MWVVLRCLDIEAKLCAQQNAPWKKKTKKKPCMPKLSQQHLEEKIRTHAHMLLLPEKIRANAHKLVYILGITIVYY